MDRWPSVREVFYDRWSILSIKNKKSLTNGSITSMKMRPKVSIDSIDWYYRYRSIDPSPIVPIYAGYMPSPSPPLWSCLGARGRYILSQTRAFPCYKYLSGYWRSSLLSKPPTRMDLFLYWSGVFLFPFYSLFVYRPFPALVKQKGGDGFMLGLLGRLCSPRLNESNHQRT